MCEEQSSRAVRVRTAQTQKMKCLRSLEIDERRGKEKASSSPHANGRVHDEKIGLLVYAPALLAEAHPRLHRSRLKKARRLTIVSRTC